MAIEFTTPAGLDRASEILTAEALSFVEALHHNFADRRAELLGAREQNRRRAAETGTLTSCRRPGRSARGTGRSPRRRRPCRTAGSR
jgi:malate synthase